MSRVEWTRAQDEALSADGELLVSASAGSGKTTVMIERVMRFLKDGGHVRRLLVLTFSRASANEMKDKLVEKLYDAVREGGATAELLRKEIKELPFALICTIDSFCYELYNRYTEASGAESNLKILEPEDAELRFCSACESVAEEYLAAGDEAFSDVLEFFKSGRKFDAYFAALKSVRGFLDVSDDPKGFLERARADAAAPVEDSASFEYLFKYYLSSCRRMYAAAENILREIEELSGGIGNFTASVNKNFQMMGEIVGSLVRATSLKDLFTRVAQAELPGSFCPGTKMSDEASELCVKMRTFVFPAKDLVKEIRELLKDGTKMLTYDELVEREKGVRSLITKFTEAVGKSIERYAEDKAADGAADFADVEHIALRVLDDPEIRKEFSEQIDRIFLDEYQDTNYLQEEIIRRVSRGNTFMVGDVKQSIYKFRHAEPKLFTSRYRRYADFKDGTNVLLNDNFRSDSRVLDFVNLIFKNVMSYDFGDVDYKNEAMLTTPKTYDTDPLVPPVTVAEFKRERTLAEFPDFYTLDTATKDENKFSEEAEYVVAKINSLVGQHDIFDTSLGARRLIEYRDVAVLTRNRAPAKPVIAAMRDAGIPYLACGFDTDDGADDIGLLENLLSVIDNAAQDIPLFAVMRSPIGGFSEAELLDARKARPDVFFWEAAKASDDEKFKSFFNRLGGWEFLSHSITVSELLSEILSESGFDSFLISTGDPVRISAVNTYIGALREKDIASDIRRYLEFIRHGGRIKIELPPASDNAVGFYTIHGSKGLEFPIVFLIDAAYVNRADTKKIYADDELGFTMSATDADDGAYKTTISCTAQKKKSKIDATLEEMRLTYVALTRAKYHLFITYTGSAEAGLRAEDNATPAAWINYVRQFCGSDGEKVASYFNNEAEKPESADVAFANEVLPEGIPLDINFRYSHADAVTLGTKFSVSELNSDAYDEDADSRVVQYLATQNTGSGTLYHKILEKIDFSVTDLDGLKAHISEQVASGELPSEAEEADLGVFANAINGEVFKAARSAQTIREQPFMLYVSAREAGIADCDDKVLVQGVIDLLILGEENVLVDYKFSRSGAETLRKRYATQIKTYALAAEKLLNIKLNRKIIYVVNQNLIINI